MAKDYILDRTMTATGVSIGTGLALETLFDVELFDKARTIPKRVDPASYDVNMYNVYTLFRNVLSSIKFKDKDHLVHDNEVKVELLNDMHNLMALYEGVDTELLFYLPKYDNMYKLMNKHKKGVYTPYSTHTMIRGALASLALPGNVVVGRTNGALPTTTKKVLLSTHFTVDLLSGLNGTRNLQLIESHTGVIKDHLRWYTKYRKMGKRDMNIFPFNKRLLYLLGDNTVVAPIPLFDRKAFYETSATKGWNQTTSRERVDGQAKKFRNNIPV